MFHKMRIVVAIFTFVCVNANVDYVLPVPGCVVVDFDAHAECFAVGNGTWVKPDEAKKICASTGGQLATIQHEKVWKFLIENLLKNKTSREIWLGFTLLPFATQLTPNLDLKNMSAYWSRNKISSLSSQQYMFTFARNAWDWRLSFTSVDLDYLCQYSLTKHCIIANIDDPNVVVSPCVEESFVSHNTRVEITCSPGYYLNSSQIITCRNGVWDKPRCVAGCLPPTPKDHAILISAKPHYDIGDSIFYVCEDNYYTWRDFAKTHFTLTCQNDSTWSDADARCSLKQNYPTITINASEVSEDKISLKCELRSTTITWVRNNEKITNNSVFTISPQGELLIKHKYEKVNGFYRCQTIVGTNIQIGNLYSILGHECNSVQTQIFKKVFSENNSIIMHCPQDFYDQPVQWFKDEEEIKTNEHQKIIMGGALLLQGMTQRDSGIYKCQITCTVSEVNTCKCNGTSHLTVTTPNETICGVKSSNRPSFYQPWFVTLQHEDEVIPFCFGALLNDRWVVTSAFCLSSLRRKKQLTSVFAQLGSPEAPKKYPVSVGRIHPKYKNRRNLNDIGLIRLDGDPVEFNDDISPVCFTSEDIGLVHKCENRANLKGILTGWSTNVSGKRDDLIVESVEMNLASKDECRTSGICEFADDKFCTRDDVTDNILPEPPFDDFGSPFVITRNEKEYLLGIFTGGNTDYYDYFTSIHHHYDWIKSIIT